MEVLAKLGIETNILLIQIGVFIVAYFFISKLLFKPYLKAYLKREEATTGQAASTESLNDQSQELQQSYEQKMKALNFEMKSSYDQAKKEAQKESSKNIEMARQEAKSIVEKARCDVADQMGQIQGQLTPVIQELSSDVATKVLRR